MVDPFSEIMAHVPSQTSLAAQLGISPQALQSWRRTGRVPAHHVLRIEEITGVSRTKIRPDIYPSEGGVMVRNPPEPTA